MSDTDHTAAYPRLAVLTSHKHCTVWIVRQSFTVFSYRLQTHQHLVTPTLLFLLIAPMCTLLPGLLTPASQHRNEIECGDIEIERGDIEIEHGVIRMKSDSSGIWNSEMQRQQQYNVLLPVRQLEC